MSGGISARIFKAYDIRGIVDDTLTADAVRAIGRAFGDRMLEQGLPRIVVGRDGRLSSPRLQTALVDGLCRAGVEVTDIGLCTTPMMYFATVQTGTGTGIQVTGSHNPPAYNGLKLMAGGHTLYGEAVSALRDRILSPGFDAQARSCAVVQAGDIWPAYLQRIVSDVRLARPLKIVVDAGNGVGGAFAGALFRALGCGVTELFCEVDGHFPNHHPDPSRPENLRDLMDCVQKTGADVGLAFDGDADRLGVVTRTGRIIDADRLTLLFSRDVLSRHPGGKVVFDVKCSRLLPRAIREAGGVPLMWKTGHSMLKAKLRETGAALAGEMSGHLFFGDRWYGFDDGLYAGARLLEILSRADNPSAVLDALPESICTPEIQVELPDGEHFAVVESLQATAVFPDAESVSHIDGLRVDFADGFGLVRASNTTPVLTLRFEADTPQALQRIQSVFRVAILAVRPGLNLPF